MFAQRMLVFITVIGNREHDQDGEAQLRAFTTQSHLRYNNTGL